MIEDYRERKRERAHDLWLESQLRNTVDKSEDMFYWDKCGVTGVLLWKTLSVNNLRRSEEEKIFTSTFKVIMYNVLLENVLRIFMSNDVYKN